MAINFPEGTQNFPAHKALRLLAIDVPGTAAQQGNGDMTFAVTSSFSRYNNSNYLLIEGGCLWDGDNPNGYWELQWSADGSNWYTVTYLFEADEDSNGSADMSWFSFKTRHQPGSSEGTLYYKIKWQHHTQNGGTMYRNKVRNNQSWSRDYSTGPNGGTYLAVYEILDDQ